MERLLLLHDRLPFTILVLLALILLWGLVDLIRARVSQGLLALLWIGQLLLCAQALLGLILLLANLRHPYLALHLIYGLFSLLLLPATLFYTKGHSGRGGVATLLACCFVLFIVVLRASATAL
jgi:hypothetical protein